MVGLATVVYSRLIAGTVVVVVARKVVVGKEVVVAEGVEVVRVREECMVVVVAAVRSTVIPHRLTMAMATATATNDSGELIVDCSRGWAPNGTFFSCVLLFFMHARNIIDDMLLHSDSP